MLVNGFSNLATIGITQEILNLKIGVLIKKIYMNKNGILVCFGSSSEKNIGDYIQSVAQEQFWEKTDCFCEREELNKIDSKDRINLIMNGWFMWNPENFPPSDCINPLFISFHIVPLIADRFFTPQTIEYLKKYEPIGARDIGTKELLESYGIKSYYSSCLTLTLNVKYKESIKTNEILFVDPFYEISGTRKELFNIKLYIRSLIYWIKYRRKISSILSKFQTEYHTIWGYLSRKLEKSVAACHFYASYKDAFDDDILLKAEVITHNIKKTENCTNEHLMDYAKQLIKRYASAKLVVTSRIHCGLPCLAVETPVIYVQATELESMQMRSPGRMNGLIDFFNVFYYNKRVHLPNGQSKVRFNSQIINNSYYKYYRDRLINTVQNFIDKYNEK